jgi:hypothetical protein
MRKEQTNESAKRAKVKAMLKREPTKGGQMDKPVRLPETRVKKLFDGLGYEEDKGKMGTKLVKRSTCCGAPVEKVNRAGTRHGVKYRCLKVLTVNGEKVMGKDGKPMVCGKERVDYADKAIYGGTMPVYMVVAGPPQKDVLVKESGRKPGWRCSRPVLMEGWR